VGDTKVGFYESGASGSATRETALPHQHAPRRAADRREAICDAVFQLLGEVGYDKMSMDAVAARARASKATIYRSWPDKPSLVAEALTHRFGENIDIPDTGTLRGDLMAMLTLACEITNSTDGEVMTGVMTAAARNPALARTLHECTYESKHASHDLVVRRAEQRGELPPGSDSELLHEILYALIITRKMTTGEPLDEEFARRVVDDVLIPVLAHRKS
jgi:AcrR family transcriptional regulator